MRQQRTSIPTLIALTLIASLSTLAGCAGPIDGPRDRIGALPFPGMFTLYRPADPDNLGRHRYHRTPRVFRPDEMENGIVYTTRAGFLDVAHVRITIDSVRFCAARMRAAMRERRHVLTLPTIEGSTFFVSLRYPLVGPTSAPAHDAAHDAGDGADGAASAMDDDDRFGDELAIRSGQRLAYLMMTWHEVITWFGHRTVIFIDESPSSFTYDDAMSHVVGLRVAGRALRDRTARSFDEAVTVALRAELAELGAVSREQTEQAVRAVEGLWWSRGRPLKRQLDVGLVDDAVRPWLVPGLPFARGEEIAEPFALPTLTEVMGLDCSGFYSVRIDPGIPEADRMRELLPSGSRLFHADRDLPLLVEATRRQM
ncbi:MAG: DUF4056 domain-containing protein, partial [Tepidisphaeraceae bacterium]